jgi:radical SAM protein with 4Fe4S-binding SPASM domain
MFDHLQRLYHYVRSSPQKLDSVARLAYKTKLRSAEALRLEGYRSRLPPLMTLQVNKQCNLRCVQCWEWGDVGAYKTLGHAELRDELPTEIWKQLIVEATGWKPYLYFFGGEPLLRKDMTELVGFASGHGILTSLNSNTTLVTPRLAEAIVRAGLDYFIASLDGPREINDRIRLGHDVFDKVIAGIRALVEAKTRLGSPFPAIEVCATVTAQNHAHLLETAEVVNELGVDFFKIQFGMFTTPALLGQTQERFRREFGKTPRLFEGFVRDTSAINGTVVKDAEQAILSREWTFQYSRYPKPEVRGFDHEDFFGAPGKVFGQKVCHVPWKRAVVMPDGAVVGCPWFPEVVMGNIREKSFREIWDDSELRKFRRSLTENGLLASCSRCCDLYELDES